MAKGEQDEVNQDPQEALKQLLSSVVKPFQDSLESFQETQLRISKNVQQNQSRIRALVTREQNKPPPSILPPTVTKLLPGLINGVIKIFTQPDVDPAAASKGIFGEKMQSAYEASMIRTWNAAADLQEAQVESLKVDIALRKKTLPDEF